LRSKIDSISLRRKKDEILTDLPEKTYKPIYVELSKEHMDIYKKLLTNTLEYIKENSDDTTRVRSCMVRLIQMASNPGLIMKNKQIMTTEPSLISDEEKIIYELHKYAEKEYKMKKDFANKKLEQLDELLTTIIEENGRKVVLWTNFIKNIEFLNEHYKKYNPVLSYGAVEVAQRQQNVKNFQTDPSVKLFIANPMASKEGITLTAAQDVIFYDRSYSLVDYLQAQDRVHRIGQFGTVVVYNMIAKGTIDELIHKSIEGKKNVAGYLQSDNDMMVDVVQELRLRE
jgi:SNF2 family DNA or RNA helicase